MGDGEKWLRSSNLVVCWVGIWHLQRSTLLDEAEQDDTAAEYTVEEPQEQMPSVGGHVAEWSLVDVAGWMSHSVEQGSGHRKSEPTELYTEVQRVVE